MSCMYTIFTYLPPKVLFKPLDSKFYTSLKRLTDYESHFAFLVDKFPEMKPLESTSYNNLYEETLRKKRTIPFSGFGSTKRYGHQSIFTILPLLREMN